MSNLRDDDLRTRPGVGSWGRKADVCFNSPPGQFPPLQRGLRVRIEMRGIALQFCDEHGTPFCEWWLPNEIVAHVEWFQSSADAVMDECRGADIDPPKVRVT